MNRSVLQTRQEYLMTSRRQGGLGAISARHLLFCASASLILGCSRATDSVSFNRESAEIQSQELSTQVTSEDMRAMPQISSGTADGAPILQNERTQIERPVLSKVSIETLPGNPENMIIAELTQPASFSLSKTAPSEYVLTIRDAALDKETESAIIADQQSALIRSVRPVSQGENTVLRIFAKPEATLIAEGSQGRILVRTVDAASAPDIRAQMKPEEEGDASAKGGKGETEDAKTGASRASSPAGETAPNYQPVRYADDTLKYTGRLISLDLQDSDIDNALRIIAEVSNLNIIASDDVTGKVTLRLIDVPWDQALDVILKTNGLDKVQEGNVIRIAPVEKLKAEREALKQAQQAEEELAPLGVKYIRVSYAKAAELKPLIDNIITERGASTYDERTNQIIVKDIDKGIQNVTQLISKLDLRTPQVLLETQIVEANRSLLRDLGSRFGFRYLQSPATGNATGMNFPNSVDLGGTISNAGLGANPISLLLGSADGSKSLTAVITGLERDGRVRVVSRPSVATTNNKAAVIKSVQKIRVRLPDSGVSVATGQGASASGNGNIATETIEAGIVLEVTPQASPDYYVLLDINAKSSTLDFTRAVEGIPSEIERSASSSVLVSSGQTFALGGIYKMTDSNAIEGVPFLKDIPFFGHIFRNTTVDSGDEELLFFLTPRIVEGSFDDATMKTAS